VTENLESVRFYFYVAGVAVTEPFAGAENFLYLKLGVGYVPDGCSVVIKVAVATENMPCRSSDKLCGFTLASVSVFLGDGLGIFIFAVPFFAVKSEIFFHSEVDTHCLASFHNLLDVLTVFGHHDGIKPHIKSGIRHLKGLFDQVFYVVVSRVIAHTDGGIFRLTGKFCCGDVFDKSVNVKHHVGEQVELYVVSCFVDYPVKIFVQGGFAPLKGDGQVVSAYLKPVYGFCPVRTLYGGVIKVSDYRVK